MLTGLDAVADTHLRLRNAHARVTQIMAWLFAPLLAGGCALTAWAANPTASVPLAPVILMCCLIAIGLQLSMMLSALQEARFAAQTLAAAHNTTGAGPFLRDRSGQRR